MKTISLVNQKGGVAKTTTAMALADYFARAGQKTLLVDFDPQGSLTTSFNLTDDAENPQALRFLALNKCGTRQNRASRGKARYHNFGHRT